jgi:hypothetical protein
MGLQFERGDAQEPRGHAILYARVSGSERYVATYCIVLPISFSMAKYLPPMLSGQLGGLEAASEGMSVVPIPPMLEDIADLANLRQQAERRDDDLCDMGTIALGDDSQRMTFAAQGCGEYGQLYERYQSRWPAVETEPTPPPLDDVNVDDMLSDILPERARLSELSRLIGQARYAIETDDRRQLDETTLNMKRLARSLPEKYRATLLVDSALRRDDTGPRLAELYLQRAFKLADEDYIGIPPIDEQIHALQGGHDGDHSGDNEPDQN